jgi:hypothetical protein
MPAALLRGASIAVCQGGGAGRPQARARSRMCTAANPRDAPTPCAGNASTGPSLSKALQYLSACPHVTQRLREEQRVRASAFFHFCIFVTLVGRETILLMLLGTVLPRKALVRAPRDHATPHATPRRTRQAARAPTPPRPPLFPPPAHAACRPASLPRRRRSAPLVPPRAPSCPLVPPRAATCRHAAATPPHSCRHVSRWRRRSLAPCLTHAMATGVGLLFVRSSFLLPHRRWWRCTARS